MEDSLGAEDPAIEIARLLRPVEARTVTKRAGHGPRPGTGTAASPPVAKSSESPPAAEWPAGSEPLLLGTSETPEIDERVEPPPTGPTGAGGQGGAGQASRRTGLARRASEVAASDRRAAGTMGRPDNAAMPPSGAARTSEPPPASAAGLETEPLGEALPKCLTEPWDDPDPGWPQAGQDRGARRWPFRRARPGHDSAGQQDEGPRASHGERVRGDDDTQTPK